VAGLIGAPHAGEVTEGLNTVGDAALKEGQ
jgi:hypothetical protein